MGRYLTSEQHRLVSDAVAEAERHTSGEIVTVLAERSDGYTDVALVWAAGVSFTLMSAFAFVPQPFLDLWDRLLAASAETPLLAAVTARLCEDGDVWRVLACPALGSEEIRSVDLAPLRLRRSPHRGRRVVLVGTENPWLHDAASALAGRPAAAVFAALDYLIDRLDLGAERSATLLQASARAAVHEAAAAERRPG